LRPDRLVRFTGVIIIFLIVVVMVEVAAFFYTTYLAKRYGILFYLPQITEDYTTYAARLNPRLGWPSLQALAIEREDRLGTGSQANPDAGSYGEFPISAYGDSFTAGFGVKPEQAWSSLLGARLGCRLANYGVPGYGTDQAYLRFHDQREDKAGIVFLGVLSENIQRNVNQFRNFLIPSDQCQTKPRFVLDNQGRLKLVPLPHLTRENYDDFIKNPDRYLKDDYFAPGGPSGAQKLGFPYAWSIIKAHKFFYDRYVRGYKSYLQFYQPDHPSGAFPLTMAIIRQFVSEAQARGQHPLVLIFPTDEDFRVYHDAFIYEPLVRALKKENIEYVDLGAEILKRLGGRSYLDLFLGGQYHHFNEAGNRLVAEIIHAYFKDRHYVPIAPRQPGAPAPRR